MIKQATKDAIYDATHIDEVVSDFVTLKKRGVNFIGLCPFHNEKTPSFTVSPAKGIFKCFGCGEGGSAVDFVMRHEHYTYPEALKYLAGKYNIEVEEEEQTPEMIQEKNERESLYVVSAYAQKYFTDQLMTTDEGKSIGLGYFKERGFSEAIIEKFQLGYNPDGWDAFTSSALENGYQIEFLEKAGLIKVTADGKQFDFFRGRVMFPIHNLTGRVIGFGGRTLKTDKKVAKYFNSPESDIYNKSKVLYGIYQAKKSIVANNNCYLVEGYTDVISLFQSDVENVVASSGTSLTTGQIQLIRRYTKNITILYDGDAAGIKASFRGIDLILEEGMNVKVVLFPEGEDPDSFSKKVTTEELTEYISDNAKDFIVFKTDMLKEGTQNDPIKKSELIHEIVNSIALIPDHIARSVYIKECSRLLDVSEQALINEMNKERRKKLKKKQKDTPEYEPEEYATAPPDQELKAEDSIAAQERNIIRLLLNYGDKDIDLDVVDQEGNSKNIVVKVAQLIVRELIWDNISFEDPVYQTIFDEYVNSMNQEEILIPDQQHFIEFPNSQVNRSTIDIISSKYELSDKWKTFHKIYTTTEDMILKQSVEKSLYVFKLKKVGFMIEELQEAMKNSDSLDEQMALQSRQKNLDEIKKQLATKLGRSIVK